MSPSPEHLRSQIYVLTAVLSQVQDKEQATGQGSISVPDYGVLNTSQSTAGKTFQHIATLLTRGTADEKDRIVAVTAGPVGDNPLQLILSTSPRGSPTVSPSTSQENNSKDDGIAALTAHKHPILVARNSSHLNDNVLVREDILPTDVSDEVRKMLSEQEQTPAFASVYPDFFQYLPIVFQVLKYAAQGTRDDRLRAELFFVTQCRAKISQRIRALFKGYDMTHLRTWKPLSYEAVLPQNLAIDDRVLAQALNGTLVPGTTNEFIFNSEHAVKWLHTLLNLLDILKELVDAPIPLLDNHVQLMRLLTRLSLLLFKIPRRLWSLNSLATVVATSRNNASQTAADLNEYTEDNHNLNEDDNNDLDDTLTLRASWNTLPQDTVRFVRALYATFAWITACDYMSHSTILKNPITISYRALDLPTEKPSALLEPRLFKEWFQAIIDEDERKHLIQIAHNHHNNLKDPKAARGACHCESGVMSALVAQKVDQPNDQPFLDFACDVNCLRVESEGLDIGVAKKSCASCWLLAAVIKEEMNINIRLPGTHSFYYPWLPPPHLPENILLLLKDKLLEQLIFMVNGDRTNLQSRTSSPASAISEPQGFETEEPALAHRLRPE